MRIAFYAPLKPPDDPRPSGDRHMARLLVQALGAAGHDVELASRLRPRDAAGDPARQERLRALGDRMAARLVRRWQSLPPAQRPGAWLTYHLYYKAPDWIGPAVAIGLGIPYVVAEASVAPKRADGPWQKGHEAVLAAIARADAVIGLNPADAECLRPCLAAPDRLVPLTPFLGPEDTPGVPDAAARASARRYLGDRFGIDPDVPWLLAVAMMRRGDKLASYRLLGDALTRLGHRPWRLIVAGDGPARRQVEEAFAKTGANPTVFTGVQDGKALAAMRAAADLMVWPAVREAWSMALLEGQAAGLPVVAGRAGGVPAIVTDGETGLLTPEGDAAMFADAVAALLDDPARRSEMGRAAARKAARQHGFDAAVRALDHVFVEVRRRLAA